MKKMINGREVTVKHIMKNGEVRDSLDGYEITIDDLPEVAVRILRQMLTGEAQCWSERIKMRTEDKKSPVGTGIPIRGTNKKYLHFYYKRSTNKKQER